MEKKSRHKILSLNKWLPSLTACTKIIPMSWDILGHAWAVDMLRQHVARQQLRHAYLFTGPQGVGSRTLALRFAQAINCPQPKSPGEPCRECRICKQIEAMHQADLSVLQADIEGGVIKVERVRELRHTLSLTPYEAAYRIALLLRFEEANKNAQNALLKTLEEPNPRVILLLTADIAEHLLPTIVSRCEILRLRPMSMEALAKALEARDTPAEEADMLAHIAGGRPGYALRLQVEPDLLKNRREWLDALLELMKSTRRGRFAFAKERTRGKDRKMVKKELRAGLMYWNSFWRDVLIVCTGSHVPLTNLDYQDAVQRIAAAMEMGQVRQLINVHQKALLRLYSANLRLLLEALLLELPEIN